MQQEQRRKSALKQYVMYGTFISLQMEFIVSFIFLPVTELSRLSMLEPGVCSTPLSGLVISIASSSISSSSSSSGISVSKSDIRVPDIYPSGGTGVWGG